MSNLIELSGYGDEIVGEEDDDEISDILAGLGYDDEEEAGWYEGMEDDYGIGDDDELGINLRQVLARLRKRGRGRRKSSRRPKRRYGRQAALRPVTNKDLRRYPLGLGNTTIPSLGSAIISANPQLPFKVERFVTDVTGFLINNIQVGTVSQFVAAGSVPSGVFRPDAVGVALRGDTAVPGVQIQVTVTNNNPADADFNGALIGLVAQ